MKEKLALIGIILVGIIAGCGGGQRKGSWLGAKTPGGRKSVSPVRPKHESVLRPGDDLVVTQPTTRRETARAPKAAETEPIALSDLAPVAAPAPATRPVPETRPAPVVKIALVTPTTARAAEPAGGEVVAASIIQVNDRFITIEDVLQPIGGDLARLPATVSEITYRRKVAAMIDQEVRRQLIQRLVLAEAQRRLTDQQKEHIRREMEQTLRTMIAETGGSRKKLEAKFIREDTTLNAALAEQRKQLTIRLYLRSRFTPTISVTGKMLWRYYNSHRADFTTPKMVQMQIITAPVRVFLPDRTTRPTAMELRAARAKAKQVIDQAVTQLVDGQAFGEVAKRLSRGIKAADGGLWDLMAKGSFKAERIEEIAFKLTEGQMAGPIATADGYYVVMTRKVRPGKQIGYEDAQEDIEKALREQQFNKVTDEYFKKLLATATIVQSKQFLKMATDRAVKKYRPKD